MEKKVFYVCDEEVSVLLGLLGERRAELISRLKSEVPFPLEVLIEFEDIVSLIVKLEIL